MVQKSVRRSEAKRYAQQTAGSPVDGKRQQQHRHVARSQRHLDVLRRNHPRHPPCECAHQYQCRWQQHRLHVGRRQPTGESARHAAQRGSDRCLLTQVRARDQPGGQHAGEHADDRRANRLTADQWIGVLPE